MIERLRIFILKISLFILVFSVGCLPLVADEKKSVFEGAKELKGTIIYKSLEGGFYALDGDDGKKYLPINLSEDFQKDGLKVSVVVIPRPDVMSIFMYGENVEVLDIKYRD